MVHAFGGDPLEYNDSFGTVDNAVLLVDALQDRVAAGVKFPPFVLPRTWLHLTDDDIKQVLRVRDGQGWREPTGDDQARIAEYAKLYRRKEPELRAQREEVARSYAEACVFADAAMERARQMSGPTRGLTDIAMRGWITEWGIDPDIDDGYRRGVVKYGPVTWVRRDDDGQMVNSTYAGSTLWKAVGR